MGVSSRVRTEYSKGGPFPLSGYRERLSPLSSCAIHAGLVHLSLPRPLLSMRSIAVRVGTISPLVHAAYGTLCQGTSETPISRACIPGRLFADTIASWNNCLRPRLRNSPSESRMSLKFARVEASSAQGRMERLSTRGAFGGFNRHANHALHSRAPKAEEGLFPRRQDAEASTIQSALGKPKRPADLLRILRLIDTSYALGPVLYSLSVLGFISRSSPGRQGPGSAFPSECPRSPQVAVAYGAGASGASDGPRILCGCAHRYCGGGLRRDPQHRGFEARSGWLLALTRHMELARSCHEHHLSRVKSHQAAFVGLPWKDSSGERSQSDSSSRRQPSSRAHRQFLCQCKSSDDARVKETEDSPRRHGVPHQGRMASICCKQVRRRALATLPPRRLTDPEAAAAFRSGWYGSAEGLVSVSATRRTSHHPATPSIRRTEQRLGQGNSSRVVSASGPDRGNSEKTGEFSLPSHHHGSGLAAAALAQSYPPHGEPNRQVGQTTIRDMGGPSASEPELDIDDRRNRTPSTTGDAVDSGAPTVVAVAASRIADLPASPALVRSTELLTKYAWSSRTIRSRTSQWKTWVDFCTADARPVLPVTEAHLLAFIGWIATERESNRRKISSTSLPQYLSAVRQMHLMSVGTAVPEYPLVQQVLRGYDRWEEMYFPSSDVRCGISAAVVRQIWKLGMDTESLSMLRNTSACLFAFCLNGLRESSVVSLPVTNVEISSSRLSVRLTVVKGKQASREQLIDYHRYSEQPSPIDLWCRWRDMRQTHPRFFGLPGETDSANIRTLDRALRECLAVLNIEAPPGGKYSSHSLRLGAHTEQVLLGIPHEVRLTRFGWGPKSGEMASLYFDRNIRTSASSLWLFGLAVSSAALPQIAPEGAPPSTA